MGRPAEVIEDTTPLAGARIDIAARIGWLLRTSRLAAHVSVREMAQRLTEAGVPASPAMVSRIETAQLRSGVVIDGYEQVLAQPEGRLRSAVDTLCRTFDYAPPDTSPDAAPPTLSQFSAAVEAVHSDDASGGDWLRFAREHGDDRRFGLPQGTMRPLLRRLCGELDRSVGTAFITRYEAIARLRTSAYADLVEEVVREVVLDAETPAVLNLMVAVSERPTPRLLAWMTELLNHPAPHVLRGAEIAIENMRGVGGLDEDAWSTLAPGFVAAYSAAADDRWRRATLTKLYRNLPPSARARIREQLSSRLEPMRGPAAWSADLRNQHLVIAQRVAAATCDDVGLPDQPLLARLVFELVYDFRGTLVGTSAHLLRASPFDVALHARLLDLAVDGPDEATRAGVRENVGIAQPASARPLVDGWLDSHDRGLVETACDALGYAGIPMSDTVLLRELDRPGAATSAALRSAGMAQHPLLPAITADPRRPEDVRRAAAWWLREGGRISR